MTVLEISERQRIARIVRLSAYYLDVSPEVVAHTLYTINKAFDNGLQEGWEFLNVCAAFFLCCKVRETPQYLRDILFLVHSLVYDGSMLPVEQYKRRKAEVIQSENLLLRYIRFETEAELPYQFALNFVRYFQLSATVAKVSTGILNDTIAQWTADMVSFQSNTSTSTILESKSSSQSKHTTMDVTMELRKSHDTVVDPAPTIAAAAVQLALLIVSPSNRKHSQHRQTDDTLELINVTSSQHWWQHLSIPIDVLASQTSRLLAELESQSATNRSPSKF